MAKMIKAVARPPYAPPADVVNVNDTTSTLRYEDVYYEHSVGAVQEVHRQGSQTFLVSGTVRCACGWKCGVRT